MLDHAHVARGHHKGAVLIFVERHRRVRALLLDNLERAVVPAAGLGAGAAVGIPAREEIGEQTAPAVGDAHRAVDEALDLGIRHIVHDFGDLGKRQLARKHHAGSAECAPGAHVRRADRGGLRRDVQLRLGQQLLRRLQHAEVTDDQCVDPAAAQRDEVIPQRGVFRRARHGVDREIGARAVRVRVAHRLEDLLHGEVARRRAHTEHISGKIHRVRPVEQRGLQFFEIARRCEQLGLFLQHAYPRKQILILSYYTAAAKSRKVGSG